MKSECDWCSRWVQWTSRFTCTSGYLAFSWALPLLSSKRLVRLSGCTLTNSGHSKGVGAVNILELIEEVSTRGRSKIPKANRLHTYVHKSDWWMWLFYTVKGLRSVVKNEYTEVSLSIHCTVRSCTHTRVPPIPGVGLLPNPPIDPPIRRITPTSRTHRRY